MKPIRVALALSLLCALSASSTAQSIIRGRWVPPPGYTPIYDGGGASNLVGTDGQDIFRDNVGGDTDAQHDAPGGPDGKSDKLDTRDGDDKDVMYGGPEDEFDGDAGDRVYILRPQGQSGSLILWYGTVAQYKQMRAWARWFQDACYRAMYGGGDSLNTCEDWTATVDSIVASIPTVPEGTELVVFADYCVLGPYVVGDVPESPADFLNWLPFGDSDPCEATADLVMTYEEHQAAVTGALVFLDALSKAACE